MAKAYTDLEQSQLLAKILPLDSADMVYIATDYDDNGEPLFTADYKSEYIWEDNDVIHCWSLAALFDTLPKAIGSYSKMMGYFDGAHHCDYIDEDGECLGNGTTADTLIDAVYEMVLKQNTPK